MSKPALPEGYLGPKDQWRDLGLTALTHTSPEIRTATGSVEVKVKTSKPTKVTANLLECGSEKEYKDLVLTQTQGNTVTLMVTLPAAGFFKLQLFAVPSSSSGGSLPNVFNYLVHNTVPPTSPVLPFPKQFAQWKDGCFLYEPLALCPDRDAASFKVAVPGAKAVAVTVNEEWFPLEQQGDGVWQGQVKGLQKFKGKGLKASLNANFGPDESKYTSLLQYDL